MRKYEVIEDNGGGLSLAVWDKKCEKVVYFHTGFEYCQGDLKECIKELQNGACPEKEWDGNCGGLQFDLGTDPQFLYDNIVSSDPCGWDIVADQDGIYHKRMGAAAMLEFGINECID